MSSVSDNPPFAPSLAEVVESSGIPYPNGHPYSHITFTLVAWNEAERLPALLDRVRPYFERVIVGVQQSDDETAAIAEARADLVIPDLHRGFGDATYGTLVLPRVETKWTLKCDADEWPSFELLDSLSNATWAAEQQDVDGIWVPFESSVEGIAYEEQHAHLRLFRTILGWPAMLHSRPPATKMFIWPAGSVRHERSLDELVTDYLRYYYIGRGTAMWEEHNKLMLRSACVGTAAVKGWPFVQSHPWWPDVVAIVFTEDQPWLQSPSLPPVATSPRKRRSAG